MAVDGRNRPDHAWSIAREATRGPHAGRPDCHGSSSWSWPVRGSASVEPASVTWQRYGDHGRELLFTAAPCPVDRTPAASAETNVEEAASTYLTFVTAWNVKMEAAMVQWDAAGSDPVKLGTVNARFAGLAEEFASRLAGMSWPSSVQSLVDRFAADE